MKKYAQKSENRPHTFERPSQPSRQPALSDILQRYKRGAIGDGTVPDNRSNGVSQMNRFTDFYRAKYGEEPAQKGKPIPRIIHRFWSGGPIHPSDFNNIIQMQQRIEKRNQSLELFASKWRQIVWTSRSFNQEKDSNILTRQFGILKSLGVDIRYYEDEFPSAKRNDSIKYVSDEVRLMALSKYGGTYMDMDIGPGEETFETDLYHRKEMGLLDGRTGYLPLLGSVFPFREDKPSLEEEEAAYARGYYWNYFFSSQKGNPVIGEMLKQMQRGIDGQQILGMLNIDELFKHAYVPWDLSFSTPGSSDKKESGDKTGTEKLFTFNGHEYFYNFDFTPSDGNCFFHAVLQALEQAKGIIDITPQQLRRSAFRHTDVPLPRAYRRNGIWVDDRMAAGVVAFLHTRGVDVTIQVHYLMADGSHFHIVTYGNGPDVLDIVMKDNFAHFTYANQL